MKSFLFSALAFALVIAVLFQKFLFGTDLLMLNIDQLGGLGARFLRVADFVMAGWDDSRVGGIPTLDALFGDIYHPLVLLQWVFDPARAVGFKFIACVWIAFISAFLLVRHISGRTEWAALLGFLYALNPQFFTHIYGGHDGKMMVFAVAPLAVLGIRKLVREGDWSGFFLFTMTTVWMVLSSHLQLTYFFLWGAGFYTLFEALQIQATPVVKARRVGLAAAALALGLGLSAFQIIPPYEYTTKQSVRGTGEKVTIGHATSWSLHPEELASMLVPGFLNPSVHDQGEPCPNTNEGRCSCYWGHNSFKLNQDTAGTALTLLAFLGLFVRRNRKAAIFWLMGSAVILSYSMGANSPFFEIWYNFLPGVKNFRAPAMAIFWIPLAMVLMATPVLEALQNAEERKRIIHGLILFSALVGLVTLCRFAWESVLGFPAILMLVAFGLVTAAVLHLQEKSEPLTAQNLVASITSGFNGPSRLELLLLQIPFLMTASFFLFPDRILTNPEFSSYFKPLNTGIMSLTAMDAVPYALFALACATLIYFIAGSQTRSKFALAFGVLALLELVVINSPYIQETPGFNFLLMTERSESTSTTPRRARIAEWYHSE